MFVCRHFAAWVLAEKVEGELHVREVELLQQREAQDARVKVEGAGGVLDAEPAAAQQLSSRCSVHVQGTVRLVAHIVCWKMKSFVSGSCSLATPCSPAQLFQGGLRSDKWPTSLRGRRRARTGNECSSSVVGFFATTAISELPAAASTLDWLRELESRGMQAAMRDRPRNKHRM